MPLLPSEPDIFPADLLEIREAPEAESGSWWALYTLSRREKELMRRLRALGIGHYGPVIAQRGRTPAGRARISHLPLFSNYVFLCGSETDRSRAMSTRCISRCLEVPDAAGLIRDLRQVRRLIESGAALTPEARIEAGARVRVRSGSLQGLEGTVIRRQGENRLLVSVQFLQKGASLLLDDFDVERIDG